VSDRANARRPVARRVDVLGVGISAITISDAVIEIERRIEQNDRGYVTLTGVHGVMECRRDTELTEIHNAAALTCPDGMPMVWAARYAGHRDCRRVYGPDLMLAACEHSVERGWRHYFYGAGPGVADDLAGRLLERFPGLQVAGTYTPPFGELSGPQQRDIIASINRARADIVWVGLSTPKQERWMAAFRDELDAAVLLGVGAAFDLHAGRVPQAPRWVQQSGFEWAYRLAREPRRLWRRYLANNPRFVLEIARCAPRTMVESR
jgi:N-acetylglucosaminyldiphosphoundecaprenol N-acetyl-beta-D-mannosaminyltransferase